ncbi:hypothetical protein NUW58_g1589 [Xylaria curta]|uniref:Uncharacterized protein n=1 Tax=Xylaria curta TaxID=42375 RepID=A0ACC1PMT2_9PEZI|nr:hypothetical protein NUW58_g1589 [Xylaria curta]
MEQGPSNHGPLPDFFVAERGLSFPIHQIKVKIKAKVKVKVKVKAKVKAKVKVKAVRDDSIRRSHSATHTT